MIHITWDYYEIWYHRKKYQVLIPKDISQLWIVYYPDADGHFDMDIDFFGNRKGLEAIRNACAALSKKDNIIVYLPCKKNNSLPIYNYFFSDDSSIYRTEFVDMVFMKPNSIKVSDWKEIRKCISKTKSRQWGMIFTVSLKICAKKRNINIEKRNRV